MRAVMGFRRSEVRILSPRLPQLFLAFAGTLVKPIPSWKSDKPREGIGVFMYSLHEHFLFVKSSPSYFMQDQVSR